MVGDRVNLDIILLGLLKISSTQNFNLEIFGLISIGKK
jgi:hypothetical protein